MCFTGFVVFPAATYDKKQLDHTFKTRENTAKQKHVVNPKNATKCKKSKMLQITQNTVVFVTGNMVYN